MGGLSLVTRPSDRLAEEVLQHAREALRLVVVHHVARVVELDLAAMMRRKDKVVKGLTAGVASLFKKNGVAHVRGSARIAAPGSVSVEGADAGTLLHAPDCYMDKIAIGPGYPKGTVDLDAPPNEGTVARIRAIEGILAARVLPIIES